VEYLEGKDLGGVARSEIGPGVPFQFERIIDELQRPRLGPPRPPARSNILLVNGKVFVVDLASAFHPGGVPLVGRLLLASWALPTACRHQDEDPVRSGAADETERRIVRVRNS